MKKNLTYFLLFLIVACGQTKQEQVPDDWKTFEQSNHSISYPPTWKLFQTKEMEMSFVIYSTLESNLDKFKENISFNIQDLSGQNMDLDKYAKISEEQIKTFIAYPVVKESKRVKNDRGEYHKLIYTGDQEIFKFIFEQYIWIVDEEAYVLTLTSEQDKFNDFKETGEKILNSFKFIKK